MTEAVPGLTVAEIYKKLFAGSRVVLLTGNLKKHESLRTSLCRMNAIQRAVDLTEDSITATYNQETGRSTFALAKPKNFSTYELIEETPDASQV